MGSQKYGKVFPSEYFRCQCYIAVDPSEPYLTQIIEYIGSDNLIFCSNYSHMEHQQYVVKNVVELQEKLSQEYGEQNCLG